MIVVSERQLTHGDYRTTAEVAQGIKAAIRNAPNWKDLTTQQKESLDLIATKMSRICSGDPSHNDHWRDLAGYAELGLRACQQSQDDGA